MALYKLTVALLLAPTSAFNAAIARVATPATSTVTRANVVGRLGFVGGGRQAHRRNGDGDPPRGWGLSPDRSGLWPPTASSDTFSLPAVFLRDLKGCQKKRDLSCSVVQ